MPDGLVAAVTFVCAADGPNVVLGVGSREGLDHAEAMTPWDAMTLARQLAGMARAAGGTHAQWKPCKWCQLPIVWATTQRGGGLPLDPGDDPGGKWAMWTGPDGVMYVRACPQSLPLRNGDRRVTTHFDTCPRRNDRKATHDGGRVPDHARPQP